MPHIVTAPSGLPVSLDQAKAQCNLEIDDDDVLLTRCIKSAWKYAEQRQQRTLLQTTFSQRYDGFPRVFELPLPPLVSVDSITYIDASGDTVSLTEDEHFEVDTYSTPGLVYPAYNTCWPSTRGGRNTVTIQWVAGYTTVPDATQTAILQLTAHWYENREAEITGTISTKIKIGVDALLALDCWGNYA